MGLQHGCNKKADELFGKQFGVNITNSADNKQVNIVTKTHDMLCLNAVYGDCTAATLYAECFPRNQLAEGLEILLMYLSINARISCMFTFKTKQQDILEVLRILEPFQIVGLHVHKSNREPESNFYQITGLLKVPVPHVRNYTAWDKEYDKSHNFKQVEHFNQMNKTFNLQTL